QHHPVLLAPQQAERFCSVARGLDVAEGLQCPREHGTDGRVVVDDEDAGHGWGLGARSQHSPPARVRKILSFWSRLSRVSTLGVALGPAFARAAVTTDRGPLLLQLSDGSHAVPAVVAYQNGVASVGRAAVAKAAMRPERTVRGVKRLLGRAPT